jgi:hypothetical protein
MKSKPKIMKKIMKKSVSPYLHGGPTYENRLLPYTFGKRKHEESEI